MAIYVIVVVVLFCWVSAGMAQGGTNFVSHEFAQFFDGLRLKVPVLFAEQMTEEPQVDNCIFKHKAFAVVFAFWSFFSPATAKVLSVWIDRLIIYTDTGGLGCQQVHGSRGS